MAHSSEVPVHTWVWSLDPCKTHLMARKEEGREGQGSTILLQDMPSNNMENLPGGPIC